jgi:hypothetical protein
MSIQDKFEEEMRDICDEYVNLLKQKMVGDIVIDRSCDKWDSRNRL